MLFLRKGTLFLERIIDITTYLELGTMIPFLKNRRSFETKIWTITVLDQPELKVIKSPSK
jgi:hypothetical protein